MRDLAIHAALAASFNLEASVRSAARSERSYGADLIEAGLNEGAGRFALAPLWALFTSLGLVSWP
jgi:hypothetical protein